VNASIDHTHNSAALSWVEDSNDDPVFPVQNLPLGVFGPAHQTPRTGTAIGSRIADLTALSEAGLLPERFRKPLAQPNPNMLMASGGGRPS
jgi:fumarylacetoacetase